MRTGTPAVMFKTGPSCPPLLLGGIKPSAQHCCDDDTTYQLCPQHKRKWMVKNISGGKRRTQVPAWTSITLASATSTVSFSSKTGSTTAAAASPANLQYLPVGTHRGMMPMDACHVCRPLHAFLSSSRHCGFTTVSSTAASVKSHAIAANACLGSHQDAPEL